MLIQALCVLFVHCAFDLVRWGVGISFTNHALKVRLTSWKLDTAELICTTTEIELVSGLFVSCAFELVRFGVVIGFSCLRIIFPKLDYEVED